MAVPLSTPRRSALQRLARAAPSEYFTTCEKIRELCFSGQRDTNAKKHGPTHFDVTGTAVHGREVMKITTLSEFAPPPLTFTPLLFCPCCVT